MKIDQPLPSKLAPGRKIGSSTARSGGSAARSDNFLANRARVGGAITSTAGVRPPKRT